MNILAKFVRAFNNNVSWKMDGDKIAVKDGNPVYINSNGDELTISIDALSKTRAEAQTYRTQKEELEKQLAKFKDISDPALAVKAIETVSKLDAKKLIDAGEVDKLTEQIKSQFTQQVNELTGKNKEIEANFRNLQIANVFANSEFIRERIALPRDIFESYFRSNFRFNDQNEITAYDKSGNVLMSKKDVGNRPSYEEALEMLVEMHPQKDIILKANGGNGTDNKGGGGGRGGNRVIKRSDFNNLTPKEQIETAQKQAKGEIQIVD